MSVPKIPKSDIIYIADLDGVVKFSMPKEKAEKFVIKGKGEWVSPNLVQTIVRLRAPRRAMKTDDIIFTDHFYDAKNWKAGVVERERIFEQNSKNVLKYLHKGE
ncbi:hypothetical protein [Desulforamulus hydrothermalis]|uniref:Uncharacterized protein n=1 Tax=Desulforamulus hydrothermalis Lam5 = DSM 18033 TaxID=1121428 RepID=K8EJY0_9FIRM|nr:hypothetical protein [Desulforamulus hydrothermalis]CCO08856.1 conserved hypothetical protein [Desulforamulus hydrothermalis Lam5 = DSM 18033]SHG73340.1 hypothetical protein SAMN02745177_00172 [Desulforamulus hydrothermalis Lam5 = DSM 18033]